MYMYSVIHKKKYILLAFLSIAGLIYIACDTFYMNSKRLLIPYFTDQIVRDLTIVEKRESEGIMDMYRWFIVKYPEKLEHQLLNFPHYKQYWKPLPLAEQFVDEIIKGNFGWAFSDVDICDRYDLMHCSGVWAYSSASPDRSSIDNNETMIIINMDINIIIIIHTDT